MERWVGKVAVVTGAGSGIGEAIASSLLEKGMKVIGVDMSEQNTEDLLIKPGYIVNETYFPKRADLRNEKEILDTFSWIETHLGGIHVLVNCAGILSKICPLAETETSQLEAVWDTNVLALTICSREAIKSMKKHNINDGNIINMASILSRVSTPTPGFVLYTASKKAVQTISEGMRIELAVAKSNIKVTSISPGITKTNLFTAVGSTVPDFRPQLNPQHIADCVIFCLQLPPEAQITDLCIQPIQEDLSKF